MLFNSAAMALLELQDDTPDPVGGFFVRDPVSGMLSGVAHEYAQFIMERKFISQQSEATAVATYRFMDQLYARLGVTTVQLMALQPTAQAARLLAQADPKVRWRIIRMPMPTDAEWPLEDVSAVSTNPHPRVTVSGLKWLLDGTPIERGAAMRAPYADREDSSGRVNFESEDIEQMLHSAIQSGEQPMFHAVGDRTIEVLLDAMEAVASAETWRAVRPRIEHGDLLLPDLRERARNLGVVVVQNPIHFTSAEVFSARWDAERLDHGMPLQSLLQERIPLALGSDASIPPFLSIQLAVEHPANPDEALTREQAVVAHTLGGAYAERQETFKGSLEPCSLADLTVLSQDVFTVPVEAVANTSSVLTMVDGRIVFRAPELASEQ
jgi:predicted amidohydrolase YtcJ